MKKADLLEQLYNKLQKGKLDDPIIITKVELADEKLINIFLTKSEALKKSIIDNNSVNKSEDNTDKLGKDKENN